MDDTDCDIASVLSIASFITNCNMSSSECDNKQLSPAARDDEKLPDKSRSQSDEKSGDEQTDETKTADKSVSGKTSNSCDDIEIEHDDTGKENSKLSDREGDDMPVESEEQESSVQQDENEASVNEKDDNSTAADDESTHERNEDHDGASIVTDNDSQADMQEEVDHDAASESVDGPDNVTSEEYSSTADQDIADSEKNELASDLGVNNSVDQYEDTSANEPPDGMLVDGNDEDKDDGIDKDDGKDQSMMDVEEGDFEENADKMTKDTGDNSSEDKEQNVDFQEQHSAFESEHDNNKSESPVEDPEVDMPMETATVDGQSEGMSQDAEHAETVDGQSEGMSQDAEHAETVDGQTEGMSQDAEHAETVDGQSEGMYQDAEHAETVDGQSEGMSQDAEHADNIDGQSRDISQGTEHADTVDGQSSDISQNAEQQTAANETGENLMPTKEINESQNAVTGDAADEQDMDVGEIADDTVSNATTSDSGETRNLTSYPIDNEKVESILKSPPRLALTKIAITGGKIVGQLTQDVASQEKSTDLDNRTCKICDKILSRKYELQRHMIRAHGGAQKTKLRSPVKVTLIQDDDGSEYQCDQCDKSYASRSSLLRHQQAAHDEKKKITITSKKSVISSIKKKYGKTLKYTDSDPDTCPVCQKVFSSYWAKKKHILNLHSELTCRFCFKIFSRSRTTRRHMEICSEASGQVSKHEKESKNTEASSKQHAETKKDKQPKFCWVKGKLNKCPGCSQTFLALKLLQYHYRKAHNTRDMPFHCPICKDGFFEIGSIREHIRHKHKNLAPDRFAEIMSGLNKSSESESGSPKMVKTPSSKSVTTPISAKPSETPKSAKATPKSESIDNQCPECDKTFDSAHAAERHFRASHGEDNMPFMCAVCGRGFLSKENLKVHCQQQHKRRLEDLQIIQTPVTVHPMTRSGKDDVKETPEKFEGLFTGSVEFSNKNVPCCITCHRPFKTGRALEEHIRDDHGYQALPFKCVKCFTGFLNKSSHQHHMSRKHKPASRPQVSSQKTSGKRKLSVDSDAVVVVDPICPQCREDFPSVRLMEDHYRHEHGNGGMPYRCTFCRIGYFQKADLNIHYQEKHDNDVQESVAVTPSIETPTTARHSNERKKDHIHPKKIAVNKLYKRHNTNAKCLLCGALTKYSRLDYHFRQNHKDIELPYKCHICSQVYVRELALSNHLAKNHSIAQKEGNLDESASETSQTPKVSSDSGKKKERHGNSINSKTGKTPEMRKGNHQRKKPSSKDLINVLSETKTKCLVCGTMTVTKRIDEHFRHKHNDIEFPYKCTICSQVYVREVALDNHMSRLHGIVQEGQTIEDDTSSERSHTPSGSIQDIKIENPGISTTPKAKKTSGIKKSSGQPEKPSTDDLIKKSSDTSTECLLCASVVCTPRIDEHFRQKHSDIEFPYKCPICDQLFVRQIGLHNHINKVHTTAQRKDASLDTSLGSIKASSAVKSKSINASVDGHSIHNSALDSLKIDGDQGLCITCGYRSNMKLIEEHFRKVHKNLRMPHRCDDCGREFFREPTLRIHINKFHQNYNAGEKSSGKQTKTDARLVKIDTSGKRGTCLKCGYRGEMKYVEEHFRILHPDLRMPHKCPICDREFFRETVLKYHIKTHKNEQELPELNQVATQEPPAKRQKTHGISYTCHFCKSLLKNKKSLIEHIDTFHGGAPFPCSECNESFYLESDLNAHSAVHEDQEEEEEEVHLDEDYTVTYGCKECSTVLQSVEELEVHFRTKHDERQMPYHCAVCSMGFFVESGLETHVSNEHASSRVQVASNTTDTDTSVKKIKESPDTAVKKKQNDNNIQDIVVIKDESVFVMECDSDNDDDVQMAPDTSSIAKPLATKSASGRIGFSDHFYIKCDYCPEIFYGSQSAVNEEHKNHLRIEHPQVDKAKSLSWDKPRNAAPTLNETKESANQQANTQGDMPNILHSILAACSQNASDSQADVNI